MQEFKFADIGEGLHEGKISTIYVKEGDLVKEGDAIFSVETDKITSDIPSPYTGKLDKLYLELDATIHVGDLIALIAEENENTQKGSELEEDSASVVGEVKVSNEVLDFSSLNKKKKTTTPAPKAVGRRAAVAAARAQSNSSVATKTLGRRAAVAAARAQATKKNIEPEAIQSPQTPISSPELKKEATISGFKAKRIKISSVRKAIAKAMITSRDNVAYFSLVHELNVTKLWNLRSTIKNQVFEATNVKLTFLAFILKAVTIAIQEFPVFGAKYDSKTEELVYPGTVNLGIAVDTKNGLFVPVIKDAHLKSIVTLGAEIIRLASLARDGKLKPNDMQGATFTVTNYGSVGSLFGSPVINYPEVAILGTGAIFDAPVLENGKFVVGKAMHLTTAADHRFIDGSTVGRFTSRLKELLENPSLLGVL